MTLKLVLLLYISKVGLLGTSAKSRFIVLMLINHLEINFYLMMDKYRDNSKIGVKMDSEDSLDILAQMQDR